ncbi:MAG: phage head morphogenesis protein [Hyphomonadaceae bacterium]|nr:phage head morphogenesis protein [Hyphomonadaceae bacterium]
MFTCEAVEKAKPSDIEALAEKLEPALARAVRDLIKDHVASVDLSKLEEALKEGQTHRILEIIGEVDPVKAQAVREGLQNAVWAGGALAVQSPVLNEARFAFQRLNPALITWLEGYSLNLIREIGEGTRAAVRSALVDGMTKGVNPIQQARQIKQAVGLTESQSKAVQNYRRALETVHTRRSLKRWGLGNERSKQSGVEIAPLDPKTGKPKDGIHQWRLRDQRYDNAIRRAQENKKPLTPEQIDRMVDRYQERMIQHRARTIARAESMRALNAGTGEAWRQAVEERKVNGDLVRKFWKDARTERECEECRSLARDQPKRGIPMNAEFVSKKSGRRYKHAPAHPNCLCHVFYRLMEPEQLAEEAA